MKIKKKNVLYLLFYLSPGMSGEMMSQSCCDFIKNCSKAGIQATDECIGNIFKELNNYFHTTYLS